MAEPLTVTISHRLGQDEARRRLKSGFSKMREQIALPGMAVEERWEGDNLHFSARALMQQVTGRIEVEDTLVRIEVMLPGALGFLARGMKARLQQAGTLLLTKS
jgi:hypothetical protein